MGPLTTTGGSALAELEAAGLHVDTSTRCLSEYSYDASNYRIHPVGVVFPRNADDVVATVRHCHRNAIALISRGGGTSMAGNAIGPGVVMDMSRYMNTVTAIDEQNLTADAEPGIVLTTFQRVVQERTGGALTFAPDPSSKSRATLGGAIGNDACGNHSVRYGRTTDHVISLDLVTVDGLRLTATRTGLTATDPQDLDASSRAEKITAELKQLAADHLAEFRLQLDQIPRQVSGYHLAHLLPENHCDVARALVGSEGTCAVVVSATVKLVPSPKAPLLVSLGYKDVVDAAADVMTILEFKPSAIEGIDEKIVKTMRARRGEGSVQGLPDGQAWLYVGLDGADADAVAAEADELLARLRQNGRLVEGRPVGDAEERASLWRVREEGAGLATRLYSGGESWGGWEDAAVAPEHLADYLADLLALLEEYNLNGVLYGHFGAGCMHVRITFDQRTDHGRKVMASFLRAAAKTVVRHGGSLSGEHGDGRARSELLPIMYSPQILSAFARFKQIWDPTNMLNPGSMVDPDSMMDNLWMEGVPDREWRTSFDLRPVQPSGDGQKRVDPFVDSIQRCVGVGKCRSDTSGVMCPSYRATRDEKDSTRGRARVLQDMVRGAKTVEEGWRSEDAREVLDLCLSCKACATDCPVGVDMATYKSEFFDHYYAGRRRPLSHYSLGWLPRWLKITTRMAPLVNLLLATPLRQLAVRLGGVTPHRALPKFTTAAALRRALGTGKVHRNAEGTDNTGSAAALRDAGGGSKTSDVVLFIDTFTRGFRPEVAGSAQRVLNGAGKTVQCNAESCCALTWISTGQLGTAKKILSKTAGTLDDGTDRPIVVVEPSCAAALKEDLPKLVPTEAAHRVAGRVTSFASAVTELAGAGWTPQWAGGQAPEAVTVQTHCHEYSVFGEATQRAALKAVGVQDVREATGCCGVAGNFGFETEHYEVSMQVAEHALIPALKATGDSVPVLTDGFSCLMQINQLEPERTSLHLAQLLDGGGTGHGDPGCTGRGGGPDGGTNNQQQPGGPL
ncbi:FAD-binding and (Fe-S)-binding domain-containing protein [Arthrobacter pigmenti]